MKHPIQREIARPDVPTIRREAHAAGVIDPAGLRYRVFEYDKHTGEPLGILMRDVGFREAVEKTAQLIAVRNGSHFVLWPIGFVQ